MLPAKFPIKTLECSIPNFSNVTVYEHDVFDQHPDDSITLFLGVYPVAEQWFKDDLMIKVACRRKPNCDVDVVPVKIKISILDSNDEKCYTQEYQLKFIAFNKNLASFVASFISRQFLITSAQQMLPNNVLTLFAEIEILTDVFDLGQNVKITNEILNDYGSLLKSGDLSDVRLIVGSIADGNEVKEFSVHKAILSARCEVFAAMFKHSNTREAQESRVDIPDVRVQVFELFLQFIYTGKISSLNNDCASELFAVADKYQINSLKQYCEQYLCSNLEIESLAQTLLLADMHQAAKLKLKCLEFFVENGDQIMKTEGWTKISSKLELMVDLVQRFVSSKGNNNKKKKLI